MAWELSGKQIFLDAAKAQLETYKKRIDEKIALNDHDVGFVYTPACVAAYRLTGEEKYRDWALQAANHLYDAGFAKQGGFILRGFDWPDEGGCRTMMDTLMNAPLLFWSAEQTGSKAHYDAALSQEKITERLLIRADASSFHHYQFEPDTFAPRCGVTWQGHSDDSCWSRGHSWGVYGFPIAYAYCREDWLIELHKDITYFMLNHLPEDMVPSESKEVMDITAEDNKYLHRDFHLSGDFALEYCGRMYGDNGVREFLYNFAQLNYASVIEDCKQRGMAALRDKLTKVYEIEEASEVLHMELTDKELTVTIDKSPVIEYMESLGQKPSKYYIEETRTVYGAIADGCDLGFELLYYNEDGGCKFRFFQRGF